MNAIDPTLFAGLPSPERRRSVTPLGAVAARPWHAITIFVAIVGLAAIATYALTPIFEASSLVLLEPRPVNVANVVSPYDPIGETQKLDEYYRTQHELMRSRSVAEPVFERFGLAADPRFASHPNPLEAFREHIVVDAVRKSRLVRVAFRSPDPEEAAQVANALVDGYIASSNARSVDVSDDGLERLRERGATLRAEVEAAAAAVDRFKEEHHHVVLDESQTVLSARLGRLNEELAAAQAARIRAGAEVGIAESSAPVFLDEGAATTRVNDLRIQIATLEEDRKAAEVVYKGDHPEVVELRVRIDDATAQLARAEAAASSLVRRRFEAADTTEKNLLAEVERQSDLLFESDRSMASLRVLVQVHANLEETQTSVVKRIGELELAQATASKKGGVSVIERAVAPPTPVWPRRALLLVIAAVVGAIASLTYCGIRARNDDNDDVGAATLPPNATSAPRFPAPPVAASLTNGGGQSRWGRVEAMPWTAPAASTPASVTATPTPTSATPEPASCAAPAERATATITRRAPRRFKTEPEVPTIVSAAALAAAAAAEVEALGDVGLLAFAETLEATAIPPKSAGNKEPAKKVEHPANKKERSTIEAEARDDEPADQPIEALLASGQQRMRSNLLAIADALDFGTGESRWDRAFALGHRLPS